MRIHRFAIFAGVALLAAGPARAQSTFGAIVGTVTDSSGAVVPSVKVTITSLQENVSREATGDELGNFQVLNLKAGTYAVAVESTGFKAARRSGLVLDARQTLRVDFVLEVGQVTEQITVESAAAVVNTETQTIGASFDNKQVLSLPINFRGNGTTSPYRALSYLPGVQSDNSFNLAVQGALPHQTEVSLDGISTVSVRSNGPITELFPSVEGIAEMKVQAVGNNAEYGQVGDITTTSRGGSNSLHGSLFEYMQNRVFDAKGFGAVTKPQKTANTFGGSVGGRIIPNRLFFFGDLERMSFRRGATIQNTVPTQLQRSGDFSREGRAVRDPLNNNTPYPNMRVPASQITSQATKVLEFYPLPNFGDPGRQASGNFRENRAAPITSNQYDVRLDHYLSSKQQIFGRWSWKDIDTIANNNLLLPDDTVNHNAKTLVLSHNYTISPRLLNEARAGLAFSDNVRVYAFDGRAITQGFGFQGLGPFPYNGLTGVTFTGATTNFGKSKAPFTFSRNVQFNDNFTWIRGSHTLKVGFDARRLRTESDLNFFGEDDYGRFQFDGRYSGDDFADFLLGIPFVSRLAKTGLDPNGTSWHYSFYAQDSFRITQKLTLEYGLRWEYHPPFTDGASNITNFDRAVAVTGRVIIPSDDTATRITAPGFVNSINACPAPNASQFNLPCTPFLKAKDAGFPEALRFPDKRNFNPRFGFAYRPFGDTKTVVRGGFGVYTMTVLGTVFYSLTGIHGSDIRTFSNALSEGRPLFRWPQISTGGSGVGSTTYGTAYFGTAVQPTYRDPYMMQYSLTVERDLGWATGLRLSYIGNRTVQLPWAPDLNQPQPSTTPFTQRPLTDRPFPYWERIYSRDSGANSLYSSMQVEFVHRYQSGLTFDTAWTWAKALSDAGGNSSGYTSENGGGRVANSLDRRADRGDIGPIRRHRWITSAIYELPFGKGRRFMSAAHPLVEGIAGAWSLSGILLLQTGPYFAPLMTGGDPSGTNGPTRGSQRPDVIGNPLLANPTADLFWNREAFVCPGRAAGANQFSCNVAPIGRFGNAGSSLLVGPGTIALNLGVAKQFPVRERARLKFEASFTNLPNHPNLADPGSANITSIAFGRITSARGGDAGGNRVGMFALRLEF
jgi:hypothetical protein